jgi:HK97 family phage prohead protease
MGGAQRVGGVFQGYASVFGREDQGRDVVMPGAFRRALARRGPAGIRMLWHHDAREPIGVWTAIREDDHGLLARGRLVLEVGRGREALALIRAGAVDGLSIGFRTVRSRTDARTGVRQLLELDLWEISLVTFPMNDAARITEAKDAALAEALRRAARGMRA